jgi:two-component system sensor histidine kinase ArlS
MKKIKAIFSQLPIRWKLALFSSLLMCLLFIIYNGIQYFVINEWLIKQEEKAIQQNMDEILIYFQEKSLTSDEIHNSFQFIENINQSNQMIRILDSKGTSVLTVTDKLPESWVQPEVASHAHMISAWHLQDHLLILRTPLILDHFTGTVEIVNNLENADKLSNMMLMVMLAGGIGAILLSAIGGVFISRQLIKPIQSMTDTMIKIKQNGLQERVKVQDNHDELSNLARLFNKLMDQLEWSFQQQQQFVEDASHELRTPIAIIEGHISLLYRWGKHNPDIVDESLSVSVLELSRLKGIVNELLELSRAESEVNNMNILAIDVSYTIQYVITNFSILHSDYVFEQDLKSITNLEVKITPSHLEQILLILLDNAVKYSIQSKEISVIGKLERNKVYIEVSDKGMGVPQEDIPYLFDRFYRVDKARSREQGGTGLGLTIADRLVKRYNGEIKVYSSENLGTTVVFCFPVNQK